MSVDMSAAAITRRLKLLEELWELSVSLMRAKPSPSEAALLTEESLAETRNMLEEHNRATTLSEQ